MFIRAHWLCRAGNRQVQGTGLRTEIGKIGKALQAVEPEGTLLQKETGRLVRNLAIIGLSLCMLVIVIYGLTRGDWLNGLLAGITLAWQPCQKSSHGAHHLPGLGAWRISQKRVLTRRVPAIETLGSATVLCVDKTGTLTLNRMSVSKLFAHGQFHGIRIP